jgi:cytochrome c-type biogenesis protein CcmH/NrfG
MEADPMSDLGGMKCSRCGAPLPADGPTGLCPLCILSSTKSGLNQDAAVSSSSPRGVRRKRWLVPAAGVIGAILLGGLWLEIGWRRQADGLRRQAEDLRRQDDAMARYIRGVDLAVQEKLDEAIAEYRDAIRITPDLPEAHVSLGVALAGQGKLDEAVAEYRAAIQLPPDSAATQYFLGKALAAQGKRDEAIAEFRKTLDIAERGSKLAQLIEKSPNMHDHQKEPGMTVLAMPAHRDH